MIIDTKKGQLFQQQSAVSDLPIDASAVESQVEIIKSETIALAVIKKLHLTDDPEFVGPGGGLIGTLLGAVTGLFASNEPPSEFRVISRCVLRLVISELIESRACRSDLRHRHCLPVAQSRSSRADRERGCEGLCR